MSLYAGFGSGVMKPRADVPAGAGGLAACGGSEPAAAAAGRAAAAAAAAEEPSWPGTPRR